MTGGDASSDAGNQAENNADQIMVRGRPALAPGIVHSHFSVQGAAPQRQLLAWRDRVGHIIDVLPSLAQLESLFNASIDRYAVGALPFTDCRSDLLSLERLVARISTDSIRDYVFHAFLKGGVDSVAGFYPQRRSAPSVALLRWT